MSLIKEFHKKVGYLVKGNVWDRALPDMIIDENVREETIKNSTRIRGSVRITHGLFYTDEERKNKINMMLKERYP